jgi:hypothetical protein
MDGEELNDYVMAIRSVGDILQHYDSDKRYPVYGFGAKLPPSFTEVGGGTFINKHTSINSGLSLL